MNKWLRGFFSTQKAAPEIGQVWLLDSDFRSRGLRVRIVVEGEVEYGAVKYRYWALGKPFGNVRHIEVSDLHEWYTLDV